MEDNRTERELTSEIKAKRGWWFSVFFMILVVLLILFLTYVEIVEKNRDVLVGILGMITGSISSMMAIASGRDPSEVEELNADYSSTGVSLGRHPMEILREQSKTLQRCKRTIDLPTLGNRRFVRIAGLVTGRQRPGTASGVIFLTLEDETGNSNIVVWTTVQERCREALLKGSLLMVKGVVETDGNVVHVIAQELTDCSSLMAEL